MGDLEAHHAAHGVSHHEGVLDLERSEHGSDVHGHSAHTRRALLRSGHAGVGPQFGDRTGVFHGGEPGCARDRPAMASQIGGDHPVACAEVAQLVRPQLPAQHEPVQQHDGGALAALDDVDAAPVVGVDDVLHTVIGDGETLRSDVVGAGAGARHQPVLGRPSRGQRRACAGGHTLHQPAPVQRSLVAHD